MSRRPDLFVVGAPRCGTTKLHADLERHPQVFMSARKEPHYFCTDVHAAYRAHQGRLPLGHLADEAAYLRLFAGAGDARRVGESSVYYLYSDAALAGIRAFAPEARIVILLRDPVDFLVSLHARLFAMTDETRPFREALALEPERRAGRRVPSTARFPGLLFYSDYARFSERVARWRAAFPRTAVLLLDDLRRSPQASWERLQAFLEVEPVPLPQGAPQNETVEARSLVLARFLRRRWLAHRYGPHDRRLERLNTRPARARALDPALRAALQERWRGEVEALSALLERDLVALWGYPGAL